MGRPGQGQESFINPVQASIMAEFTGKVAFIINTASYERVAFALSLATAAATTRDVRLLFGHGGVMRLKKGFTNSLGKETAGWLRERIELSLKKGNMPTISELLETLKKLGGKIYACPVAMELHNLTVADLVKEVDEVRSAVRFIIEDTNNASVIYV